MKQLADAIRPIAQKFRDWLAAAPPGIKRPVNDLGSNAIDFIQPYRPQAGEFWEVRYDRHGEVISIKRDGQEVILP